MGNLSSVLQSRGPATQEGSDEITGLFQGAVIVMSTLNPFRRIHFKASLVLIALVIPVLMSYIEFAAVKTLLLGHYAQERVGHKGVPVPRSPLYF